MRVLVIQMQKNCKYPVSISGTSNISLKKPVHKYTLLDIFS